MADTGLHRHSPPERGELNQREFDILEAVISNFISTARPVGSRALSRSMNLGLSPASIRNTMSDLEQKGYLYQPFQSAGRVPTDKAYRLHVNNIDRFRRSAPKMVVRALQDLGLDRDVDRILKRAAEALSVVTQELGVGLEPIVDEGVLEGLELIRLSSERVMLVLNIGRGLVKTIFVELESGVDGAQFERLAIRLRDRLVGLTLREIRRTGGDRLKEAVEGDADPLNVFVQSGEALFDFAGGERELVLGETSKLATQPEFSDEGTLRSLISLTDKKQFLVELMKHRAGGDGLSISIGSENELSQLSNFTIVTDTYRMGRMRGIIGVIGPTRMSYSRVISIVEYTSRMLSQVLQEKNR